MELEFRNWLFVFARAGGFFAVLPPFASSNLPRQLRVGLGALMAFVIAPVIAGPSVLPSTLTGWFGMLAVEVIVGLTLGFLARMVFYAADFAGRLIANEMGLSMARTMNPMLGEQTDAPGLILFYFTMVMMLTLDLHHWLIAGFHRTCELLPPGGVVANPALLDHMVNHTRNIFVIGTQMAAPVIACAFIIMLLFSVLGRLVPQMNSFVESFGVRVLAGLAVFGLTIEIMAQHLLNYLRRLPEDMMLVATYLAGGG